MNAVTVKLSKSPDTRLGMILSNAGRLVVVDEVSGSSAADEAGLLPGDVLQSVDGSSVANAVAASVLIAQSSALILTLLRPETREVWLHKVNASTNLGIQLEACGKRVCVRSIDAGCPASSGDLECGTLGLRVGDELVSVGMRCATSASEAMQVLGAATGWVGLRVRAEVAQPVVPPRAIGTPSAGGHAAASGRVWAARSEEVAETPPASASPVGIFAGFHEMTAAPSKLKAPSSLPQAAMGTMRM